MSSSSIEKKKDTEMGIKIQTDIEIQHILSRAVIPFSELMDKSKKAFIYDGTEKIPFEKRHPIFKALMRTEFEVL